MATKTTNLGLTKPDLKDVADISVINDNMDVLDNVISSHTGNKSNPHNVTAEHVGADVSGSAASALESAKYYTDTKITDLIGGAPSTLDTIEELAKAMQENDDVVEAINAAITTKVDKNDFVNHINDDNPHQVSLETFGVEATSDELNNLVNIQHNVQEQLDDLSERINDKANMDSLSATNDEVSRLWEDKSDVGHTHNEVTSSTAGFMSIDDKNKLDGLTDVISGIQTQINDQDNATKNIQTQLDNKSDLDHTHTAADVGADASGSAASALESAKTYTDDKIAEIFDGDSTTLETLKEIATAMEENADVIEALDNAINSKADIDHTHKYAGSSSEGGAADSAITLAGLTTTVDELNYVDGVTSNIQIQLNKQLNIIDQGTVIAAETDLDTLKTAGIYYCEAKHTADLINCPVSSLGFKLIVINGYNKSRKHQFLLRGATSDLYYRMYNSTDSEWTDWVNFRTTLRSLGITASADELNILKGATVTAGELNKLSSVSSNIQTQLNNMFNINERGTNIPQKNELGEYNDLNTRTIPGNYFVIAEDAPYIQNSPIIDYGYKLIVVLGYTRDRFHQFILPAAGSNLYYRTYNSSAWSKWANLKTTLSDLGVTATVNELNHMTGAKSNIQAQLDDKAKHGDIISLTDVGTKILSDEDLDTYQTPGNYYCHDATIAKTLSGCPVYGMGFRLIVMNGYTANTRRIQMLVGNTSSLYIRVYTGSEWREWVNLNTSLDDLGIKASQDELNYLVGVTSDIQEQLNQRLNLNDGGSAIVAGSDLNSLITPGLYSCLAGNTASIINSPVASGGFKLMVMAGYGNGYYHQMIFRGNTSDIYYRTYSNVLKEWSLWVNLSQSAVTGGTIENAKTLTGLTASIKELNSVDGVRENVQAQIDDLSDRTDVYSSAANLSHGHLYKIYYSATESVATYKNDGNATTSKLGSRAIAAPKNLCLSFSGEDASCYLYFYTLKNGSYTPNWSVLRVDTSNGLNYLSQNNQKHNLIKNIPDSTYFRIIPVNGTVEVCGWDGERFGFEVSADTKFPAVSSGGVAYMKNMNTDGGFGLTIPGSAKYILTNDYTFHTLVGVNPKSNNEPQLTLISTFGTKFIKLPNGYHHFRVHTTSDENSKETTIGYVSDKVFVVCEEHIISSCLGRAARIENNARKICSYEWVPAKNLAIKTDDDEFQAGVTYKGIPYSSLHNKAHFVGWHISPHTFLNAMADDQSVAYTKKATDGEPYYGLVCSTFATMACGWPYPQTTAGFHYDPQLDRYFSPTPVVGSPYAMVTKLSKDGKIAGHTFVPVKASNLPEGWSISTYECTSPVATRTTRYGHMPKALDTTGWKNTDGETMFDNYGWVMHHRLATIGDLKNIPYLDLDDHEVVGGTARPHKGDKSVYAMVKKMIDYESTDEDDTEENQVLINIKNKNSKTLYVCTYTTDENGKEVAKTGYPKKINITSGTTQIDVRGYLSEDGIYYVYTDVNPEIKESFEYIQDAGTIQYKIEDGKLAFVDKDFWYALCTIKGSDIYLNANGSFLSNICYVPSNANMDQWNERGTFGTVRAAFKKSPYGYGAYATNLKKV